MALVRRPSERRWSERTLRAAQGRMQGQAFLVTLFSTEKSDSPSRAKPAPSSNSINDQERVTFIQQKNLPVRYQPTLSSTKREEPLLGFRKAASMPVAFSRMIVIGTFGSPLQAAMWPALLRVPVDRDVGMLDAELLP